jgi:hypothetical protein
MRVPRSRLSALVCVLIVGFLLYNPFLALLHSPGGLSVQHQARNRATVGAAELQHYSPVSSEWAADTLPEERCSDLVVASDGRESHLHGDLRRDAVITPDFSSNLWFRPPPTA